MLNETKNLISVIIPVYNEDEHIYNSIIIINREIEKTGLNYELITIDDGSIDNSYKTLSDLSMHIKQLKVIKFSRNFGKEAALCAGLDICKGDACITMDADLQHPPYLIADMIKYWHDGYNVVECVKKSRGTEHIYNKIGSKVFYGLLKNFSGFDLNGASDFKLMDRKVIESWRNMKERNTFFRGMSAWLGYKRIQIYFEVPNRAGGQTHWSISSLTKLAITAITSFSSIPLRLITVIGNIFLVGAIILFFQTLIYKIIGRAISGFTTVILLELIIGSLIMVSLGIIGEYLAKIYDEVKFRPRYIIQEITDNSTKTDERYKEVLHNHE